MDARNYQGPATGAQAQAAEHAQLFDVHRHIALLMRRRWVLAGVGLSVFALSAVALLARPPQYAAVAQLRMNTPSQNVMDSRQAPGRTPAAENGVTDTEVEVLKSRALAASVVRDLDLTRDPQFNPALSPPGPLRRLLGGGAGPAPSPAVQMEQTIDRVQSGLTVRRSGATSVVDLEYEAGDPDKAAALANAFAQRYLAGQLESKVNATRNAGQWLDSRLAGLRDQVVAAEAAVQTYKAQNGLLSASGETLTEQDISNLNAQLATARAAQAEAAARLSTARSQLARGSTGEDVGEALNSTVVQQLRGQRAEVSRQVADFETRYGPRHPEMIKARRQLADIDGQIRAEIRRIVSNLEAQAQVASQRTASIAGSLNQSRGTLAANSAASVRLNELQRNADSTRTLYQSFLDRFKQTSAQQGIEGTDAVIVSPAKPPTAPSSPNLPKGLLISTALALIAGFGAVFLAEALQKGFSTSEEMEDALGLPVLASIPLLSSTVKKASDRRISPADYVVERPFSAFPEAFRNLRTAIEAARPVDAAKVIVMTSALPDEGKTTSAVCLARTMALAGSRVVIVDCDLRRRGLSRIFGSPEAGLLEVLDGRSSLDRALVRDDRTEAFVLPLGRSGTTVRNVFGSPQMDELLRALSKAFDFVVLDGAPVLPVADTRILAPKADAVVLLARWRKSPRRAVESALRELRAVGAPLVGAAFTQVDVKEQARSGYGDAGYYYRAYSRYYLQ